MPCTDGGTPVTIDRLFGFVNDGTTQSAVNTVPKDDSVEKRRLAGLYGLVDVLLLATIDANYDRRGGRQPVRPGVNDKLIAHGDISFLKAMPA
jgi:hypothetical protein